jgi:hypothetical protein
LMLLSLLLLWLLSSPSNIRIHAANSLERRHLRAAFFVGRCIVTGLCYRVCTGTFDV